MAITILSPELANQIAAGEVVERPASVVKELIENSLDAMATKIDVHIDAGGSELIRIVDNGVGIDKAQLPLALARHATSKIHSMDDLLSILSFGFRGEALASISSVSRLTLTSKPKDQPEAWQVYAEGREMNAVIKPAAHPTGTTVEVRNLFYNTPARRKFLRSHKTEFNHIDEVIRRVALARYDVAFTLTHNGKRVRFYPAVKEPQSIDEKQKRVATICGNAFLTDAKYITWQHFDLKIEGWLAFTADSLNYYDDASRISMVQYCYVNGRMVRDKVILHAIRQAIQTLADNDSVGRLVFERVGFVIYLVIPPEQVDVNVHPAKHEVRFHQNRMVHDFIYQAILQTLETTHTNNDLNRRSAGPNQFIQSDSQNRTATLDLTQDTLWRNRQLEQPAPPSYQSESVNQQQNLSVQAKQPEQLLQKSVVKEHGTLYEKIFSSPKTPFTLSVSHKLKENASAPKNRQTHKIYTELVNPKTDLNEGKLGEDTLEMLNHSHSNEQQSQVFESVSDTGLPLYNEYFLGKATFGQAIQVINQHFILLVNSVDSVNTHHLAHSGKPFNTVKHQQEFLCLLDLEYAEKLLMRARLTFLIAEQRHQPLLVPIKMTLSDKEWAILERHETQLKYYLFSYEKVQRQKVIRLNAVGAVFRHLDLVSLFLQLLVKLSEDESIEKNLNQENPNEENLNEQLLDWLVERAIYFSAHTPKLMSAKPLSTKQVPANQLPESQFSANQVPKDSINSASNTKTWTLPQAISLLTELERMEPQLVQSPPAELLRLIPSSFN